MLAINQGKKDSLRHVWYGGWQADLTQPPGYVASAECAGRQCCMPGFHRYVHIQARRARSHDCSMLDHFLGLMGFEQKPYALA